MPKLLPSRTKYRKVHKGRVRGVASRGNSVSFGEFGIQRVLQINQARTARCADRYPGFQRLEKRAIQDDQFLCQESPGCYGSVHRGAATERT